MRINAVETFHVSIPFNVPFVVWRGELESKDHVLVRISTDAGLVGWGEAAPFLFYSPETASDVSSLIDDVLAAELIGRDPGDVRAIYQSFEMLDGHLFAKCAIEMALWDIVGKIAGLPLNRLLGGPVRNRVPVTTVLHTDDPAAMANEGRALVDLGFNSLKIKIGFGLDQDVAMVAAVREAVGRDVLIRVDAEEHYTAKEALAIGKRLEPFDLELISQPVARTDWDGMAFLRASLASNVLADEGIHSPHDVLTCLKHGAADMVNIKVLKSGGLLPTIDMAGICQAAHLPVMIGSMIESGIGTLFGAHIAAMLPNVFSTELCGTLLLAQDLLADPVQIDNGSIVLNGKPGLGSEIDLALLDRHRVR